jgi:hypothetical protein
VPVGIDAHKATFCERALNWRSGEHESGRGSGVELAVSRRRQTLHADDAAEFGDRSCPSREAAEHGRLRNDYCLKESGGVDK